MELNRGVVYSEATKTQIRQDLGLDQPIFIQYVNWLLSILSGNMGTSYLSGKDVSSLFFDKLPQTLYLTLSSILLTLLISLPLGILSAIKQNKIIDYIIRLFSFIGNSLPGFVVALILIYIFSVQLKLIPVLIMMDFITIPLVVGTITLGIYKLFELFVSVFYLLMYREKKARDSESLATNILKIFMKDSFHLF